MLKALLAMSLLPLPGTPLGVNMMAPTTAMVFRPMASIRRAGSIELTTAWGVAASYEHFWSKKWQTSLYGSYSEFKYNATANANACAGSVSLLGAAALTPGCDNNFSYWDFGSRTQFNLDSNTYVGLDIVYQKLNSASAGLLATLPAAGSNPAGLHVISDQSAWVGEFRIHRNFYP